MSVTTIFLTKNDFINFADYVLKSFEASFIPAVSYEKPENKNLKSIKEIEKHLLEYLHEQAPALTYHITSLLWSLEPIYFDFVENDYVGSHYSAVQRYGGPSIDFTPRIHGLANSYNDKIISGQIGDYPYYISGSFLKDKTDGYKTIDRPENLKNAFTDITKFIKNNGHKVVNRNTVAKVGYAMPEAFDLYKKGLKLMQGDLTFERE